ncbi:unnamed protein product [Mytilus coruscus]|uniref:Uncharacterized protein n=1 Tax=Mytilus coruscus TaxID=42192 RepID=A0A6J8EAT3_MYTCO|nr:unnamed protein product [Mytilus coruscus]
MCVFNFTPRKLAKDVQHVRHITGVKNADNRSTEKMHKKEHQCGEVNCKTCKDYYEPGHLCFMMPIQDEKKLSSVADDDTKLKRNTQDEHPNQVYIFFDFECTQDDLVQCEQGYKRSDDSLKCKNCKKSRCGVYEHKPNLCVVHKVCSDCFEHNVNSSSTCDTCAQGYNPEEKHSIKALKWLRYVSKSKGIHIQHTRNGGEKKIGDYRVDGYHKNDNGEEIVFEYHGCFWHGCSKCYSKQTVNTVNKMTMADLHQRTLEKKSHIENQGYKYISKWECEFDKEIIENIDIKTFCRQCELRHST